mmetsp:Transcript_13695/g.27715  ORF Transcript_13695/g.27715 Transcript_13695/m.27715 type:complete len:204 (-) Transcript_13695:578-1189(-)
MKFLGRMIRVGSPMEAKNLISRASLSSCSMSSNPALSMKRFSSPSGTPHPSFGSPIAATSLRTFSCFMSRSSLASIWTGKVARTTVPEAQWLCIIFRIARVASMVRYDATPSHTMTAGSPLRNPFWSSLSTNLSRLKSTATKVTCEASMPFCCRISRFAAWVGALSTSKTFMSAERGRRYARVSKPAPKMIREDAPFLMAWSA